MTRAIMVLAVLGMVGCGGSASSDPACSPCGGGNVGAYIDGTTVCYDCSADNFIAPGLVCSTGHKIRVPPQ